MKNLYVISELDDDFIKVLNILNSAEGLTPTAFAKALPYIQKLSLENLKLLYSSDHSVGVRSNVENEILRGVLKELLRDNGEDCNNLSTVDIVDEVMTFNFDLKKYGTKEIPIYVVNPDRTIRAREFVNIAFPVYGKYFRRLKKRIISITCCIDRVFFTDRLGMPLYLSSLSVHFDDEEFAKYKIAKNDLAISERSFKTTQLGWYILYKEILKISGELYGSNSVCLRKHFVDSFSDINIIDDEEIDQKLEENILSTNYVL